MDEVAICAGKLENVNSDPREYLHSLGRQLLPRVSSRPDSVLSTSSQLQAVANALVVLGLLGEDQAESVLADHRLALEGLGIELRGVKTGELTLRAGSAHGFAEASRLDEGDLCNLPLSISAPGSRLSLDNGDLGLDCLVLTASGLRCHAWVEGGDTGTSHFPLAAAGPAVVDDLGRSYRLMLTNIGGVRRPGPFDGKRPTQRVGVELHTDPVIPRDVRWLEFSSVSSSSSARATFGPLISLPSEKTDPTWPTPAECYLAWLAPDLSAVEPDASFGVGLTAKEATEVVAAVGDALLAVGTIPVESSLLRQLPDRRRERWQERLASRYARRVRDQFRQPTSEYAAIALGARFPFERAAVAIDWVIVHDNAVVIQLYVSPDTPGEYWPVATPCFDVIAIDDAGGEHEAIGFDHWRWNEGEGWGDRLLWPPIGPSVRSFRLQVNTLWEAAWVELELPAR